MLNKKAITLFVISILLLGAALTFSSIQKNSVLDKVCSANETQDTILENLLENAEEASVKQLNKEAREGKESNYTIKQIQELYFPTYEALEENNAC